MKIDFNQDDLDLLMPESRRLDIPPHKLMKQILKQHFENKLTPIQEGKINNEQPITNRPNQ